ncbi:CBO0543 family protein [Bacillus oleivorans]|uniref:CBO0543 family protein n=1 Tax=Bacillus oleivorans TaxID=1448271 RepID=UPI000BE44D2C|nr:CBO0543 family protein [Bacillus oleivorans]
MNLCVIFTILYIIAAWKWGDWKHWRDYYPTILFLVIGDLLYQFMLHDYSMWEFVPVGLQQFNITHTHVAIMEMVFKYPSTILLYLGNFPNSRFKRIAYIGLWVIIYSTEEWFKMMQGSMIHVNGWSMHWSILFNVVMFTLLAVHHRRPLLAWVFSGLFIYFLFKAHDVPISIIK